MARTLATAALALGVLVAVPLTASAVAVNDNVLQGLLPFPLPSVAVLVDPAEIFLDGGTAGVSCINPGTADFDPNIGECDVALASGGHYTHPTIWYCPATTCVEGGKTYGQTHGHIIINVWKPCSSCSTTTQWQGWADFAAGAPVNTGCDVGCSAGSVKATHLFGNGPLMGQGASDDYPNYFKVSLDGE